MIWNVKLREIHFCKVGKDKLKLKYYLADMDSKKKKAWIPESSSVMTDFNTLRDMKKSRNKSIDGVLKN